MACLQVVHSRAEDASAGCPLKAPQVFRTTGEDGTGLDSAWTRLFGDSNSQRLHVEDCGGLQRRGVHAPRHASPDSRSSCLSTPLPGHPGWALPRYVFACAQSLWDGGGPAEAAGVPTPVSSCVISSSHAALCTSRTISLPSSPCSQSPLNPGQGPEGTLERASCTRWVREARVCRGQPPPPALSARWMGIHACNFIPKTCLSPASLRVTSEGDKWLRRSPCPRRILGELVRIMLEQGLCPWAL